MGIFLFMGVALSNHLLPGFNNLIVFDKIQFSSDSTPFTMYLNFDKTLVGIFIYLFILKNRDGRTGRVKATFNIRKLRFDDADGDSPHERVWKDRTQPRAAED